MVEKVTEKLAAQLPDKATNILLIGSDHQGDGDPGRSDSQILVRLDPQTKSISMLSIPRDLRVDIPGYGEGKMNSAYSYGGPAKVIETFTQLTGLPINHFIEIDFNGFASVVNIVGGVYLPVDHRYYNPDSSTWKSIDIQAGYQRLWGHDALDYVRFRHDQRGDFTRMQRQQLFLKEMQRQSSRWSKNPENALKLITEATKHVTSDIDSLASLRSLVALAFEVDTSKVATVHLEGATPTVDGISYVESTPEQIAQAVAEFTQPVQTPTSTTTKVNVAIDQFDVSLHNTTYVSGLATSAASQLEMLGYKASVGVDAQESPTASTIIYAPPDLASHARTLSTMFSPAEVRTVDRAPGTADGISIFLGSSFDGAIDQPAQSGAQQEKTILHDQPYDVASWQAADARTDLNLQMPLDWAPGLGYEELRTYDLAKPDGTRVPAMVAVGTTPSGGYFDIQVMRWTYPPAIAHPSGTQTIKRVKYLLFYQGADLHMVAWHKGPNTYWVMNSFDNELSNELMMALATSFKIVA